MTEPLRIVDTSSYQGVVQWEQVKASGVAGGIVKASEGTAVFDPQFARSWSELARLGMFRGAYHFACPQLGTRPEDEADHFLAHVLGSGPLQVGDALVLDLESGSGNLSAWASAWLHHVEQAVGFMPLLYSFDSFIRGHLQDPALATWDLWLAAYSSPTEMPACPPPWNTYALWQWTDASAVPGVPDACDESLIHRDLVGLRALGKPAEKSADGLKPAEKTTPSPPPAPVTHRVRMVTTQWLRALPRADSARLVECTAGEVFGVIGPPTMHWTHVTAHGQRGWLLSSNVERVD